MRQESIRDNALLQLVGGGASSCGTATAIMVAVAKAPSGRERAVVGR